MAESWGLETMTGIERIAAEIDRLLRQRGGDRG
jgi:hypothetical protein